MRKAIRGIAAALCALLVLSAAAGCAQKNLLVIEGEQISRKELDFYLTNAVSSFLYNEKTPGETKDLKELFAAETGGRKNLEIIVDDAVGEIKKSRALERKFDELKLLFTTEEKRQIESTKQQLISAVGGEIEYKRYLSLIGITNEMYEKMIERDYKAKKITDTVFAQNAKYEVLPKQIEEYFDENYLRIRHILVTVADGEGKALSEEEKAKKKVLADEIYEKAVSGADFEALMREYDESVYESDEEKNKYLEGYVFKKGELDDAIYEAAKDLPVGGVAPVFETAIGYHIIKAYDIREKESLFENQRENIVNYIEGQIFTDLVNRWSEALSVQKDDAALYKIDLMKYVAK